MYIKKPVLVGAAVLLVVVTVILSVGVMNPFGFTKWAELAEFSFVTRQISKNFYKDVNSETYMNTALEGIAAATGDPYTAYFWGENAKAYGEELSGNYQGIGVYIENNMEDNTIQVVSAIVGTPAEEAGITTGDKILKVNGEPYTGSQINAAVQQMRGAVGETVCVTLWRKRTQAIEEIELLRQEIEIPNVESDMLTDTIGRISITQFTEGTMQKFGVAYNDLAKKGMEKLVIDLRNNPGGLVDEAAGIANAFIEEGNVIVYTLDKKGRRNDYPAIKGQKIQIPIVILTNPGSASASEILTGALKHYGIGYQIGEKTYGKGVVQAVYPMDNGNYISVTTAQYYTPADICIHGTGIEPDKEVVMDVEKYVRLSDLSPDEDEQLQAALEYLSR